MRSKEPTGWRDWYIQMERVHVGASEMEWFSVLKSFWNAVTVIVVEKLEASNYKTEKMSQCKHTNAAAAAHKVSQLSKKIHSLTCLCKKRNRNRLPDNECLGTPTKWNELREKLKSDNRAHIMHVCHPIDDKFRSDDGCFDFGHRDRFKLIWLIL